MPNEEIKSAVKDFVIEKFLNGAGADELDDSTELVSGGIVDSVGVIKLMTFLEESFDIELEPDDMELDVIDSLEAIATLVAEKRA